MAIYFVTGLPRTGKTLWTLCRVRPIAEKEKRRVYTCNIPGINVPGWLEIDHPDKWMEVPDGSIIIVDELQDFWSKQMPGSRVPLPILELSKHGKRGIDFYFITQEPDLVHSTPRSLCQHHYFIVRAFGSQNVVIYKFERMQLHPEKVKSKGEKLPWRYNKAAFDWYKSADTHNVKRQIPIKVFMIPVALALAGLAAWAAVGFFSRTLDRAQSGGKLAGSAGASGPKMSGLGGSPGEPVKQGDRALTPAEFAASFVPRAEGFPQTASRYDKVQTVTQAPKPAACIEGVRPGKKAKSCGCWTQQATPVQVPEVLCQQIVAGGFFDDTLPIREVVASAYASPAPAVPGAAAVSPEIGSIPAAPDRSPVSVAQSDDTGHGYALRNSRYLAERNAATKSSMTPDPVKAAP
ncbi:MAG: zonular occludens toxin domain-containing protein [Polaromonas sp.]|nr:zonular occludens toxin domain-containing protein [Polaromonas sp.]